MGISKTLFLVIFSLFVAYSHAYTFYVGGREGWVLHPSESYSDWASRNRFQVNDTLVFKYKKGEDSVLEVSQQNYDQCNLNNPVQKMDTGDSVFKFDRSGPFFFISGTGDRCKQGQKLVVVVLAVRPKKPTVPVSPNPPFAAPAGSPVPNGPISAPPMITPVSPPTVSPVVSPPALSPGPSGSISVPPSTAPASPNAVSPAPSPFSVTPPLPSPSASPSVSPSLSPLTQPPSPLPSIPTPVGSPAAVTPTPQAANAEGPDHAGSAPAFSNFRVSSVAFALVVVMLNYEFFN